MSVSGFPDRSPPRLSCPCLTRRDRTVPCGGLICEAAGVDSPQLPGWPPGYSVQGTQGDSVATLVTSRQFYLHSENIQDHDSHTLWGSVATRPWPDLETSVFCSTVSGAGERSPFSIRLRKAEAIPPPNKSRFWCKTGECGDSAGACGLGVGLTRLTLHLVGRRLSAHGARGAGQTGCVYGNLRKSRLLGYT